MFYCCCHCATIATFGFCLILLCYLGHACGNAIKLKPSFLSGIQHFVLVTSPSLISKLGLSTWISVCKKNIEANFGNFSYKGLIPQYSQNCSRYPPCVWPVAQGRCFWLIGFILSDRGHGKDVHFLSELFGVVQFWSHWLPKLRDFPYLNPYVITLQTNAQF